MLRQPMMRGGGRQYPPTHDEDADVAGYHPWIGTFPYGPRLPGMDSKFVCETCFACIVQPCAYGLEDFGDRDPRVTAGAACLKCQAYGYIPRELTKAQEKLMKHGGAYAPRYRRELQNRAPVVERTFCIHNSGDVFWYLGDCLRIRVRGGLEGQVRAIN